MKVLFITPYPFDSAPSQRFRFEQYFKILQEGGFLIEQWSFLDKNAWGILYQRGNGLAKVLGVLKGFARRLFQLLRVHRYDIIFIHREATPLGPPWWEWVVANLLRKKMIYDFDDAIWMANTSNENNIVAGLKWHGKTSSICKWSWKISAGNLYLAEYARERNPFVTVNPTTIDLNYQSYQQKKHQDKTPVTIGWTGSHSTMKYLESIMPELRELSRYYDIRVLIISNKAPDPEGFLSYVRWNGNTEVDDLLKIDIGIMPLEGHEWAKGKCGFKALQFMSLGIPVVASSVGVNTQIITESRGGLLVENQSDWQKHLVSLLDLKKRKTMGKSGYEYVKEYYSVEGNSQNFLSLFEYEK